MYYLHNFDLHCFSDVLWWQPCYLPVYNLFTDDEDEEVHAQPDKNELQNTIRTLSAKLEDLSTCNDLITKHGAGLQRALSELEQLDSSSDLSPKVKAVNERATLFRITSNAMINVGIFVKM